MISTILLLLNTLLTLKNFILQRIFSTSNKDLFLKQPDYTYQIPLHAKNFSLTLAFTHSFVCLENIKVYRQKFILANKLE
jgi:hypothetical protein